MSNNNNLEIKVSKSGQPIPVVNGIHLHSMYNPQKEAKSLVEKHEDTLRERSKILVLGLGFAYHIDEIANKLQQHHGDNFEIHIIEPNSNVYSNYTSHSVLPKNSVVYCDSNVADIYENKDHIKFLVNKPGIISHPPSFNMYKKYFQQYLTYNSPQSIESISKYIQNEKMKDYLSHIPAHYEIQDWIKEIKTRKEIIQKDDDFLFLAFEQILKQAKPTTQTT